MMAVNSGRVQRARVRAMPRFLYIEMATTSVGVVVLLIDGSRVCEAATRSAVSLLQKRAACPFSI